MYDNGQLWPRWYNPGNIPAHELVGRVARHFGVSRNEMCGAVRQRPLPQARAVVALILRERGFSYKQAGRFFGNRDPKSVRHACDNFENYARIDPRVRESYEHFRDQA